MSNRSEPHQIHSKHLKSEAKTLIREHVKQQLADPANMETDGEPMASWVISLLENCHLYDWYDS